MKTEQFLKQNHPHIHIYVTGAKDALNYRGFDDFMVYYTLLSMGVPKRYIQYIGKEERDKRVNKTEIKNN